jgi:hypothetical protein
MVKRNAITALATPGALNAIMLEVAGFRPRQNKKNPVAMDTGMKNHSVGMIPSDW